MTSTPLVSAAALRTQLDSGAAPLLVDCGFDLADPAAGERAWAAAHLPGAFYLHLDRDLSGAKTGRNGRHPLPARADFAATIGRLGIGAQTAVVAYDRQGGPYAARLWWLLRWLGHEAVAVLDGGFEAWVAAGGGVEAAAPVARPAAPYPERAAGVPLIAADALQAGLGTLRLMDARAPERFRGDVEPLDPVAGHIPGALNRFFKDNLGADGRFKPAATLRAEFEALLGRDAAARTVHQCGSGVTACHNLLAMEQAGLAGSSLYAGSWSEWCAEPARPVARG